MLHTQANHLANQITTREIYFKHGRKDKTNDPTTLIAQSLACQQADDNLLSMYPWKLLPRRPALPKRSLRVLISRFSIASFAIGPKALSFIDEQFQLEAQEGCNHFLTAPEEISPVALQQRIYHMDVAVDAQSPTEHGARGFLVRFGDIYVGNCEGRGGELCIWRFEGESI